MEFRFTEEEEEFRQEVHQFFLDNAELLGKVRQEEVSGAGWGQWTWELLRR